MKTTVFFKAAVKIANTRHFKYFEPEQENVQATFDRLIGSVIISLLI